MGSADMLVIGEMSPGRRQKGEASFRISPSTIYLADVAVHLLAEDLRGISVIGYGGTSSKPFNRSYAEFVWGYRKSTVEAAFPERNFEFVEVASVNTATEAKCIWREVCDRGSRLFKHMETIYLLYDRDHIERAMELWRRVIPKEVRLVAAHPIPHEVDCPLGPGHEEFIQRSRRLWRMANWVHLRLLRSPLSSIVENLKQPAPYLRR